MHTPSSHDLGHDAQLMRPQQTKGDPQPAESQGHLVKCALLLDLGAMAASFVAVGLVGLIERREAAWLSLVAVVLGGIAACVLWRRARSMVDREPRSLDAGSERREALPTWNDMWPRTRSR